MSQIALSAPILSCKVQQNAKTCATRKRDRATSLATLRTCATTGGSRWHLARPIAPTPPAWIAWMTGFTPFTDSTRLLVLVVHVLVHFSASLPWRTVHSHVARVVRTSTVHDQQLREKNFQKERERASTEVCQTKSSRMQRPETHIAQVFSAI